MMPKALPKYQSISFTTTGRGRLRELTNRIGISYPIFDGEIEKDDPRIYFTTGLWDTGASNSVITKYTAKRLSLLPFTKTRAIHAGGTSTVNVYLVNIYLPNNLVLRGVNVTECEDNPNFGIIIGMDIITAGDFCISNLGGNAVFSYRYPSMDTIDFVNNPPLIKKKPISSPKKVGRNDPCPCGSGKKYKLCCGKTK